jgi:hypothetical protein
MLHRRAAQGAGLAAALVAAACGVPEQKVVDQYFGALNAKDTQTLSSFAAVSLDTKGKRVDKWTITNAGAEKREPAPLPDLVKKMKDADAALANHTKAWNAYKLDHYADLEKVRDLLKTNAKIPANLSAVAAEYDRVNQADRDLKRALAEARDAVEKEKRNVALSLGALDNLESLTGDMLSKQLDLALSVGGEAQNYQMTLRKYEMGGSDQGPRPMSRWVIYGLQPAS